eukprot:3996565-Pyramimonas_sp.AAC.1
MVGVCDVWGPGACQRITQVGLGLRAGVHVGLARLVVARVRCEVPSGSMHVRCGRRAGEEWVGNAR